jgi:DNA-binding response OmpR family regulator
MSRINETSRHASAVRTTASAKRKILVVDDEKDIVDLVAYNLGRNGYEPLMAYNGNQALDIAHKSSPDLIILDLMLPGLDGMEVARRLKAEAQTANIPIVMLTAKGEETDVVVGLTIGADDYVTKPFSTRELIARIRSAVRRVRAPIRPEDAPIEIGEIRLEPAKRMVTKRGAPIKLTRKEFDILYCLMSRAGRVVTYARLLTAVWGAEFREEVEYLRTFVRQLRKKIEDDPSKPIYLLTDVYVGYRFADAQMLSEEPGEAGQAAERARVPEDML